MSTKSHRYIEPTTGLIVEVLEEQRYAELQTWDLPYPQKVYVCPSLETACGQPCSAPNGDLSVLSCMTEKGCIELVKLGV